MKVTITERHQKEKEIELNSCWLDRDCFYSKIISETHVIKVADLKYKLDHIGYDSISNISFETAIEITEKEFQEAFQRVYNRLLNGN